MATLETSPEANCDRRTGRRAGGQDDKATYRGSSYRSAQKMSEILDTRILTFCNSDLDTIGGKDFLPENVAVKAPT